jgi:hypothetical protein
VGIIDFLVACMNEDRIRARDAEHRRAFIAHLSIAVTVITNVVIAFTGFQRNTVPLTISLILVGIYGLLANLKLYERSQYHDLRARKLRIRLDELNPDAQSETTHKEAEQEHKQNYPRLTQTRLSSIWLSVHGVAILLGTYYTILSLNW